MALVLAAADATPDAASRLVLARAVVARHRAALPDLATLILGVAAGSADAEGPDGPAIRAVREEAAAAEPAFREGVAAILARALTSPELRRALLGEPLRDVVAGSPRGAEIEAEVGQHLLRSIAAVGERAERRVGR